MTSQAEIEDAADDLRARREASLPAEQRSAEESPVSPYADAARAVYGDQFKGLTTSEREADQAYQTRLRGYQELARQHGERVEQQKAALPNSEQQATTNVPADSFTTAEVQAANRLQQYGNLIRAEAQKTESAARAFLQGHRGVNLNEFERTDRARAVQIRRDWAEFEQRWKKLQQAANGFQAGQQHLRQHIAQRRFLTLHAQERQKLLESRPALRDQAHADGFAEYLLAKYSENELNGMLDARVWAAEYNSWQSDRPKRQPKFRKKTTRADQTDDVSEARARLRKSGKAADAVAPLSARRSA